MSNKTLNYEDRDNKQIVLEIVKENGLELARAGSELRADKEVVLLTIKNNVEAFKYANRSLHGDKEIIFEAVTKNTWLFGSASSAKELPQSEVIFREVYTKSSKGKTNVKKFLIYKTNKEDIDSSYSAYVFHSTDFSPTRKDPMKKDIRISNSKDQIELLCKEFMDKNVKKGWSLV